MAIGVLAFAIASWAMVSRYLPITNHLVLVTAAFSPYLMLCAAVSALSLILARRWIFAFAAVGVTVTTVVIQLPLYLGPDPHPTTGPGVRLISANLREGQANPEFIVRSARAQADVLALQELTLQEVNRLSAAGLDATFPYRWLDARAGASGVGLWSRFPINDTRRDDGYEAGLVSARLQVPGIAKDPSIVVVHIPGPWPQPIDGWRQDLDPLPHTLLEVAERASGSAVIVAGDLNSTTDMRTFRGLLRNGYRDAAEQSGAGIAPTFPAGRHLPPLIAIDHILNRGCTATSLHTMDIPGSDHRGLVATVQIPRSSVSL